MVAPITARLAVLPSRSACDRGVEVLRCRLSIAIVSVALIGGLVGVPHVRTPPSLVMVALLSGASFGLLFVFYDQAGDDSGMWPILGSRLASGPMLVIAYLVSRPPGRIHRRTVYVACSSASSARWPLPLPAATRRGLLSSRVVVAMYPATGAARDGLDESDATSA